MDGDVGVEAEGGDGAADQLLDGPGGHRPGVGEHRSLSSGGPQLVKLICGLLLELLEDFHHPGFALGNRFFEVAQLWFVLRSSGSPHPALTRMPYTSISALSVALVMMVSA